MADINSFESDSIHLQAGHTEAISLVCVVASHTCSCSGTQRSVKDSPFLYRAPPTPNFRIRNSSYRKRVQSRAQNRNTVMARFFLSLIGGLILAPAAAAMAGTNAYRLRQPTVHRGASGIIGPPRETPTLDETVAFARQLRKAFTHKMSVKRIHEHRTAFPMTDMQACIDTAANGDEVEECFLPGESEAAGWSS